MHLNSELCSRTNVTVTSVPLQKFGGQRGVWGGGSNIMIHVDVPYPPENLPPLPVSAVNMAQSWGDLLSSVCNVRKSPGPPLVISLTQLVFQHSPTYLWSRLLF